MTGNGGCREEEEDIVQYYERENCGREEVGREEGEEVGREGFEINKFLRKMLKGLDKTKSFRPKKKIEKGQRGGGRVT